MPKMRLLHISGTLQSESLELSNHINIYNIHRVQNFIGPGRFYHRVHAEWRLPISGVYPIVMEYSALAGEGEG
jgi:hypothetical protein